jgi:hypothetical protein
VDPFLGRSFAAIAAEGRSQHKSQGMGTLEPLGPSATSLLRVRSVVDAPAAESSVFDQDRSFTRARPGRYGDVLIDLVSGCGLCGHQHALFFRHKTIRGLHSAAEPQPKCWAAYAEGVDENLLKKQDLRTCYTERTL